MQSHPRRRTTATPARTSRGTTFLTSSPWGCARWTSASAMGIRASLRRCLGLAWDGVSSEGIVEFRGPEAADIWVSLYFFGGGINRCSTIPMFVQVRCSPKSEPRLEPMLVQIRCSSKLDVRPNPSLHPRQPKVTSSRCSAAPPTSWRRSAGLRRSALAAVLREAGCGGTAEATRGHRLQRPLLGAPRSRGQVLHNFPSN